MTRLWTLPQVLATCFIVEAATMLCMVILAIGLPSISMLGRHHAEADQCYSHAAYTSWPCSFAL